MKILCEHAPCGPHFVRSGWRNVFVAMGHEFRFWQPHQEPALDVFSDYEPDIFLGTTYGLDRALMKALLRRPNVKVALYASAWGPLADEIPDDYPVTRAGLQEKRRVADLKPSLVFSHLTPDYVEGVLGGWRSAGVEPVGIPNAADTFTYQGGQQKEEFVSDVSFVGGWWPYKARNLGPYVLPLCRPSAGLRVKVWGNQPWPVAQYLGPLDETDAKDVFASAAVCPNVSEPHSTDERFGHDVVERPFKILSAGGFCVSDHVPAMGAIFPQDALPTCRTAGEFHQTIKHFVAHPEDRLSFMRKGREVVLRNHTYFHRVADILAGLGLREEAARCTGLHHALVLGPEGLS